MKLVHFWVAAALFTGTSAYAATSFPQCPAVGADASGCEFLITVTSASGGNATAFNVAASVPDLGPYDSSDDTLVGVLNSSGATLTSVSLGSPLDIFGFDGDGACSGGFGTVAGCAGATDPSGYAPAGVSFSGINGSATSGTVNFNPGLAVGGSGWFSLEDALSASQIQSGVPEPSSIFLLGVGMSGLLAFFRRDRIAK